MRLLFFPGLGADERLSPCHQIPGCDIRWIRWPALEARDTWDSFTEKILPQLSGDSVFAGISFGGLAALEAARRMRPKAVILIGSLTGSGEVRRLFKLLRPVIPLLPPPAFDLRLAPRPLIAHFFGIRERAHLDLFSTMAAALPPAQVKQLCRLALTPRAPQERDFPVFSIHGEDDRIIPLKNRRGVDVVIQGGGHLLSLTHGRDVNAGIGTFLSSINR